MRHRTKTALRVSRSLRMRMGGWRRLLLVGVVGCAFAGSCDSSSTDTLCAAPRPVAEVTVAPVALSTPGPQYTEEALAARIQGIVVLETVIDCRGSVRVVDVIRPLPLGLTEAARETVEMWQFRPAEIDGRAVAVFYNLTVDFRLESPAEEILIQ